MKNPRLPLALIVAMAQNRVIGDQGGIPWDIAEDRRYFRRRTVGHAVIMGRKTYESIGRPLPRRRNLILTTQVDKQWPGCETFGSLEAAIQAAREGGDDCPFVIGGTRVYADALPLATRLYVTEVDQAPKGDAFFPNWSADEWLEVERKEHDGFRFLTLMRRDVTK